MIKINLLGDALAQGGAKKGADKLGAEPVQVYTGEGGSRSSLPIAGVVVGILFAALGLVTAIWATSFEQVNFVPTFFITPLTFLGGVFYSVEMLPPALRRFTLANPIFYMVDGVRFGMLGISDAPPWAGAALLGALAALAVGAAWAMLRSGYRLRG